MPSWSMIKWLGIGLGTSLLIATVLVQRGNLISVHAKLDSANLRISDLNEANASLQTSLNKIKLARPDNDAIAEAVAAKLQNVKTREVRTREILERAVNDDPKIRDCGAMHLPDSVRQALRSGQKLP